MTKLEIVKRKIAIEKEWLWMLTNLPDEDLLLPKNMNKREAVDESLEVLKALFVELKNLTNEKNKN